MGLLFGAKGSETPYRARQIGMRRLIARPPRWQFGSIFEITGLCGFSRSSDGLMGSDRGLLRDHDPISIIGPLRTHSESTYARRGPFSPWQRLPTRCVC
ncbi:hypothetical protein PROAA_470004 [Candidatus Propionivibrio aalborgensis]|uniref:Uncharacterized protein n=1 Tax=Candidatus Propionivibrio aalborgensis TaxID=1860101 RepID=A0A1A8Y229_9RHOO|nr:hypothetical protein PROAA_470004 [Candidatus Propionivibrio aalborgensis]